MCEKFVARLYLKCQGSVNYIMCVSCGCQMTQVCVNLSSVSSVDPVRLQCGSSVSRECQLCFKSVKCVSSCEVCQVWFKCVSNLCQVCKVVVKCVLRASSGSRKPSVVKCLSSMSVY